MSAAHKIYTPPNLISLSRLVLGPISAYLILANDNDWLIVALALMLVAELSDLLDGAVARKYQQESDLGRFIDPASDAIYRLSVFFAFFLQGWMPLWMFFLIYARELIVPYLRTFALQSGVAIPRRPSATAKDVAQAVAQIAVVALMAMPSVLSASSRMDVSFALLLAATLITLVSLIDYFRTAIGLTTTKQ